jgi:hypothetical protein
MLIDLVIKYPARELGTLPLPSPSRVINISIIIHKDNRHLKYHLTIHATILLKYIQNMN